MEIKYLKELKLRLRIFVKEHIMVTSVLTPIGKQKAYRALNKEEYEWKYADAIVEVKKLAIQKGLDPMWLCSSTCPKCDVPTYRVFDGKDEMTLLCLKCGTEY